MFHRILVPVDFSACSENALRLAIDFASKHKASLTVLSVCSVHQTPVTNNSLNQDTIMENLKGYEQNMAKLASIDHTFELEIGLAADVITEKGATHDLIIMGTKGKHDAIDKLVGSVSLKVIQHSTIPVMVIPEELNMISFDKIVFAADFKKIEHMSNLDKLRELALAYDSELHLLNVNESSEFISEDESDEAMELHNFFEDVNHAFFLSKHKDIEEGIMSYTDEKSISILALMPRKHTFLQSLFQHNTTHNVVMQLKTALLSFHE